MNKDVKIGDLVKSTVHIGIGIVIDITYPEQVGGKMLLDAAMAEMLRQESETAAEMDTEVENESNIFDKILFNIANRTTPYLD